MRKGRYVVDDAVQDIDMLTDLSWSIDTKNIVSVRWSWPRNGGIKLAAVFAADAPGAALDALLESQDPVIITKDMDKSYSRPLDAPSRVYSVFPAHFGEGSDIVILRQGGGNVTGVVSKVVTVSYRLEYRPMPLSEYRKAVITLKCSDALPEGCSLAYSKYRGGARVCEYPLGRADGVFACYMKKNETIQLYAPPEYSGSVFLFQEKS